jgi:N-acetylneuraminate lyase
MTGVSLSMPDFLEQALPRIPNFAGMKFTNPDLMAFQRCLAIGKDRLAFFWGFDELLLPAWACGARNAVGSTYNFAAAIYLRMLRALEQNDWESARQLQQRSQTLVQLLSQFGFMASAKATMEFLGVEVGPPRLPHQRLTTQQQAELKTELDRLQFLQH